MKYRRRESTRSLQTNMQSMPTAGEDFMALLLEGFQPVSETPSAAKKGGRRALSRALAVRRLKVL